MDPERGMAYFYSVRLGQRLVGLLHDPTALTAKDAALNFKTATGIDLSHLNTLGPHNIDSLILSSVINRNGRSIVYNCDKFNVCDVNGNTLIALEWTLTSQNIPLPNIKTNDSTTLIPLNKTSEDDVTYAAACHVYPINGFKVHSVSYPGAQGDFALLEGSGRSVLRTYIDVIALKSGNNVEIVSLTESKGSRIAGLISKDGDKVSEWKSSPAKKEILLNALGQSSNAVIHTSVAFPGDNMMQFNNAQKVDFAITVSNSEWIIWPRGGKKLAGINVLQGNLNLKPKWSY
jgi:hypothetical protein